MRSGNEPDKVTRGVGAVINPSEPSGLWLSLIKDLRTALVKDPLPMETVRELLAA